jgi:hypothetical protein
VVSGAGQLSNRGCPLRSARVPFPLAREWQGRRERPRSRLSMAPSSAGGGPVLGGRRLVGKSPGASRQPDGDLDPPSPRCAVRGAGRWCSVTCNFCLPSWPFVPVDDQRFRCHADPARTMPPRPTVSSGPVRSRTPPASRGARQLVPRMTATWAGAVDPDPQRTRLSQAISVSRSCCVRRFRRRPLRRPQTQSAAQGHRFQRSEPAYAQPVRVPPETVVQRRDLPPARVASGER